MAKLSKTIFDTNIPQLLLTLQAFGGDIKMAPTGT